MKIPQKKLFVALLCLVCVFEHGSAFSCYDCASILEVDNCVNLNVDSPTTECTGQCVTGVVYLLGTPSSISRRCDSTCDPINVPLIQDSGTIVSCCSSELCNNHDPDTMLANTDPSENECYSCSHPADSNCLNPGGDTNTMSGASLCAKCTTIFSYTGDEVTDITRSCNTLCTPSDSMVGSTRLETKCCEGRLCNTDTPPGEGGDSGGDGGDALRITTSLVAMAMTSAVAIFLTSP